MRPSSVKSHAHPTTRVLAVLELLQSHGRLSGAELADRTGVNRRTIRRYIALLEELGIPITTGRGRLGGYELISGFKLPPMMFTNDEALVLSLGLAAVSNLGLTDAAAAVAGAQSKLERVMPVRMKGKVRSASDSVAFTHVRSANSGRNEVLSVLSSCAHASQSVTLRYHALNGAESNRGFDPYGLVFDGGRWYAVGYCHLRQDLRSFRLDRILTAEPQPNHFARPARFDPVQHLNASIAMLPRKHAVEVLIHTDIDSARAEVHPAIGLLEPSKEGVRLRSQVDDLDWFARELARLPCRFRILTPQPLKAAVKRHARMLATAAGK